MNTVHTNIIKILNIEGSHLSTRHSYLEVAFIVSNNVGGVLANDAIVRLVNCSMMALFSSVKFETICGITIEFIDDCQLSLSMYKLLTSPDDEYESGFVRNQGNSDKQLKGDHIDAERGHMYKLIKMRDLFGFEDDFEKIIYMV